MLPGVCFCHCITQYCSLACVSASCCQIRYHPAAQKSGQVLTLILMTVGWCMYVCAGTFTANIGACVLDYIMKVLLLFHSLDTAQGALLAAVITGVGGCLSTVSTWVVEVGV